MLVKHFIMELELKVVVFNKVMAKPIEDSLVLLAIQSQPLVHQFVCLSYDIHS